MNGRYLNSRSVKERIYIEGTLVLTSPAHFGGEGESCSDMPLLRDALTRKPLLTGASIAGALRSYAREFIKGYGVDEDPSNPGEVEELFGYISRGDASPASHLSRLIVDDAVSLDQPASELRDGVAIDPRTRTAMDGKKFDMELIPAGTRFPISMELLLPEEGGPRLLGLLVQALQGLQRGEIHLGMRKRRGFGRCTVESWKVWRYRMDNREDVIAWIQHGKTRRAPQGLDSLLEQTLPSFVDARRQMKLVASFAIDGSILIRSAGDSANAPDAVHLRDANGKTVIPGTSWAGALRSRAFRIMNTLAPASAETFTSKIFGPRLGDDASITPSGGRLWVEESEIVNAVSRVQSRVMLDRFTGGAYPQHLFSEQPVWGGEVKLELVLLNPRPAEVGLLLLLLKDLWTGDLPLGGESGIGRGRLKGQWASLDYDGRHWRIEQLADRLEISGDRAELGKMVQEIPGAAEVQHG